MKKGKFLEIYCYILIIGVLGLVLSGIVDLFSSELHNVIFVVSLLVIVTFGFIIPIFQMITDVLFRGNNMKKVFFVLSIVFCITTGIFFLYKANDVELRYEMGWHDGFSAGKAAAEDQYSPQESTLEANYVASVNSNKYHILSCDYAENILESNRIYYSTADEAEDAGKFPCSVCRPDTKDRKITITQRST